MNNQMINMTHKVYQVTDNGNFVQIKDGHNAINNTPLTSTEIIEILRTNSSVALLDLRGIVFAASFNAILMDYFDTNGNAEDMAEEALARLGGHNE